MKRILNVSLLLLLPYSAFAWSVGEPRLIQAPRASLNLSAEGVKAVEDLTAAQVTHPATTKTVGTASRFIQATDAAGVVHSFFSNTDSKLYSFSTITTVKLGDYGQGDVTKSVSIFSGKNPGEKVLSLDESKLQIPQLGSKYPGIRTMRIEEADGLFHDEAAFWKAFFDKSKRN